MVIPLGAKIPEEWKDLLGVLSGKKNVMVIGDVDVGKTTLSLYLCSELGLGLVDADVGQATIGPPTLISYSSDPLSLRMEDAYFVGSITPEGHLLEQVLGTWEMSKGRRAVIDTCGLVKGYPGYYLKVNKAKLISPEAIIAIGRKGDLEHILKGLREEFEVIKIPPSKYARRRGREERIRRREMAFQRYFSEKKEILVEYSKVEGFPKEGIEEVSFAQVIMGSEVYFLAKSSGSLYLACEEARNLRKLAEVMKAYKVYPLSNSHCRWRLVGLKGSKGKFLGLGICTEISPEGISLIVREDLPENSIKEISFGELRVWPDGSHRIARFPARLPNVINRRLELIFDDNKRRSGVLGLLSPKEASV